MPKVKADEVAKLVAKLPALVVLRKGMLHDRALVAICETLPQLRTLGIGAQRMNRSITSKGLAAVAHLKDLTNLDLRRIVRRA